MEASPHRTIADWIVSQPHVIQPSHNVKTNLWTLFEQFKQECPKSRTVTKDYEVKREKILKKFYEYFINVENSM